MRAGKLRRRASLQRKQVIQDAYGAEIATWAEFGAVAAGVEPVSGREFLAQGAERQGEVTVRIRIRWRDDVRAADRAVVDDQTYEVEAALADERRTELVLMCRELVE